MTGSRQGVKVGRGNGQKAAFVVAIDVCLFQRVAEVLRQEQLGARLHVHEQGVVARRAQASMGGIINGVVAHQMMRDALIADANSLLDQAIGLERVGVYQRANQ